MKLVEIKVTSKKLENLFPLESFMQSTGRPVLSWKDILNYEGNADYQNKYFNIDGTIKEEYAENITEEEIKEYWLKRLAFFSKSGFCVDENYNETPVIKISNNIKDDCLISDGVENIAYALANNTSLFVIGERENALKVFNEKDIINETDINIISITDLKVLEEKDLEKHSTSSLEYDINWLNKTDDIFVDEIQYYLTLSEKEKKEYRDKILTSHNLKINLLPTDIKSKKSNLEVNKLMNNFYYDLLKLINEIDDINPENKNLYFNRLTEIIILKLRPQDVIRHKNNFIENVDFFEVQNLKFENIGGFDDKTNMFDYKINFTDINNEELLQYIDKLFNNKDYVDFLNKYIDDLVNSTNTSLNYLIKNKYSDKSNLNDSSLFFSEEHLNKLFLTQSFIKPYENKIDKSVSDYLNMFVDMCAVNLFSNIINEKAYVTKHRVIELYLPQIIEKISKENLEKRFYKFITGTMSAELLKSIVNTEFYLKNLSFKNGFSRLMLSTETKAMGKELLSVLKLNIDLLEKQVNVNDIIKMGYVIDNKYLYKTQEKFIMNFANVNMRELNLELANSKEESLQVSSALKKYLVNVNELNMWMTKNEKENHVEGLRNMISIILKGIANNLKKEELSKEFSELLVILPKEYLNALYSEIRIRFKNNNVFDEVLGISKINKEVFKLLNKNKTLDNALEHFNNLPNEEKWTTYIALIDFKLSKHADYIQSSENLSNFIIKAIDFVEVKNINEKEQKILLNLLDYPEFDKKKELLSWLFENLPNKEEHILSVVNKNIFHVDYRKDILFKKIIESNIYKNNCEKYININAALVLAVNDKKINLDKSILKKIEYSMFVLQDYWFKRLFEEKNKEEYKNPLSVIKLLRKLNEYLANNSEKYVLKKNITTSIGVIIEHNSDNINVLKEVATLCSFFKDENMSSLKPRQDLLNEILPKFDIKLRDAIKASSIEQVVREISLSTELENKIVKTNKRKI